MQRFFAAGGKAAGSKSPLAVKRTEAQFRAMSYLTVEVEINHGQVLPKNAEALPEKASGLLTILESSPLASLRPMGLAKGQFTVPDDFNAPLPDEMLQAFEGK